MSKAIPLSNSQQKPLGFMLIADIPPFYTGTAGQWVADCVFMGTPKEPQLFDDPGFLVISDHRDLGEHRLTVNNDGQTLSFDALAPDGSNVYISIPAGTIGDWGIKNGDEKIRLGHAGIPIPPVAK